MENSIGKFSMLIVGCMLASVGADVAHLHGISHASRNAFNTRTSENFYNEPAPAQTFSGYPAYTGPKLVSQHEF